MAIDLNAALDVMDYDKDVGLFTYIKGGPWRRAGRVAGHINKVNGYVEMCVLGKKITAHRLAWLMTYGHLPSCSIDHINGNRTDNRIANLRLAHGSINSENIRHPQRNNTSGFLGVTFCQQTKRWVAQISVSRKHKNLGRFDTPELAHAAYLEAKREMHEGCTL